MLPNPTTELCLEIHRRYCTCDHKPRRKTRLTFLQERLFFSLRGLICWSLHPSDSSDRRGRSAGAPRRDVLLESWATASPPTGSHHRHSVSDEGAWGMDAPSSGWWARSAREAWGLI